jgi:hypothetical protein
MLLIKLEVNIIIAIRLALKEYKVFLVIIQ